MKLGNPLKLNGQEPGRLLPVWLAASLALNLLLLLAAGHGLADRRSEAPHYATVLQGTVMPAPESLDDNAVPKPMAITAAHTSQIPQPQARLKPAISNQFAHVHQPRSYQPDDSVRHDDQTSQRASHDGAQVPEYTTNVGIPHGKAVRVKASHYGHGLGAGLPGAGKTGGNGTEIAAGGGAEVLIAQRPGSAFNVGGIPAARGTGPGLGGNGNGIGVGGSGNGVGMTGSGDGLGMGGQGGSSKTPKQVVSPGTHTTPAIPAAKSVAGSGDAHASNDTGIQQPPTAKPATPKSTPKSAPTPTEKTKPESPTQADLSAFRSMVQRKVAGAKTYPQSARRNGYSGRAKVSFSVGPSGNPSGISVSSSSGYSALDAAASRAVQNAAPFTPFPKGLSGSITVNVTVNFTLN